MAGLQDRVAEKQASRDRDMTRLAAGMVTREQLRAENSFFACLDLSTFRIVAIGGQPIKDRR